mmetsp:Transcript_59917/g.68125  ORF Transcript_59917/g.68125 Transcript_59917/m.68125 type:complete len:491 (-) Transcript_59917:102-1574(-)
MMKYLRLFITLLILSVFVAYCYMLFVALDKVQEGDLGSKDTAAGFLSNPCHNGKCGFGQNSHHHKPYCQSGSSTQDPKSFFALAPHLQSKSGIEKALTSLGWKREEIVNETRFISRDQTKPCYQMPTILSLLLCAPRTTNLFLGTSSNTIDSRKEIIPGYNTACNDQILPYNPQVYRLLSQKDDLYLSLQEVFWNRPECFTEFLSFPTTYVLSDPDQCERFFEKVFPWFGTLRDTDYIVNIGSSPKISQYLRDAVREMKAFHDYQNGENCGDSEMTSLIIQEIIRAPFLIGTHRVEIRAYSHIVSFKPMLGFMATDFMVRLTRKEKNDGFSKRKGSSDRDASEDINSDDKRLKMYLQESRSDLDADETMNQIYSQMHSIMTKVLMALNPKFELPDSFDAFQILEWDFLLDQTFHLWVLDINSELTLQNDSIGADQNKNMAKLFDQHFEGKDVDQFDLTTKSGGKLIPLFDFRKNNRERFFGEDCSNLSDA